MARVCKKIAKQTEQDDIQYARQRFNLDVAEQLRDIWKQKEKIESKYKKSKKYKENPFGYYNLPEYEKLDELETRLTDMRDESVSKGGQDLYFDGMYQDALDNNASDIIKYMYTTWYSRDAYKPMNDALRGVTDDSVALKDAEVFQRLLTPDATYQGVVHRGTGRINADVNTLKVGDTFVEPGFTSTNKITNDRKYSGDIQLQLNVSRGVEIQKYSRYNDLEDEVLLLPSTEFRVDSIRKEGKVTYIEATEITPQTRLEQLKQVELEATEALAQNQKKTQELVSRLEQEYEDTLVQVQKKKRTTRTKKAQQEFDQSARTMSERFDTESDCL